MNEPTMDTLARRLDRVEREMEGRWKGDGREMEGRWKGDGGGKCRTTS
jgi:hypothetical protein